MIQRVSQVLWSQLEMERREQHISCVELFYRLHCLAPSASICEDIICQALLHKDKVCIPVHTHKHKICSHIFVFSQCLGECQFNWDTQTNIIGNIMS